MGFDGPVRRILDILADISELDAQEFSGQGVIAHREGDQVSAATDLAATCKVTGGKACNEGPVQLTCSRGDWKLAAELFGIYSGEKMTRVERTYELAYCLDRLREHGRAQEQCALAAPLDAGSGDTLCRLRLASERVSDLTAAECSY